MHLKIVLIIFVVMKTRVKAKAAEKLTMHEILKKYWGYEQFRPMQQDIINSILACKDTLALLPTGGGKSITYQVPALMKDGLCIVITPLIALMKDQVDRLRSLSIPAVAVHSGLSPRQIDIAFDNCVYGDIKFLYVSPERVASEMFKIRARRMNVSMIAVDEAHCISQWGYDFRPSYLKLAELREYTDSAPILALTASATQTVVEDITEKLKFRDGKILKGNFARPNLVYAIRTTEDKDGQIDKIISGVNGSGIIYTRSRMAAEKLAKRLNDNGVSATYYHAGLPHTERALRQEEWINNEVRVIVATNAFGMGIDKSDVRFVVHLSMSESLESYYQEAGRAGRDGKRSYAVLLYANEDQTNMERAIDSEFPPMAEIKEIYDKICSSLQVAIGDGEFSSHIFNIYEFCAKEKLFKGKVLNALKILEANNYMTLTEELANPARIMFCVSRDDLYKIRVDRTDLDHFLRVILRMYEGLFTEFRQIDEIEIAHWSGYTTHKVKELLTQLWRMRVIRYVPSNRSALICFNCERLSIDDLYISPQSYKIRKDHTVTKFTEMLQYAHNKEVCRSRYFENYFSVNSSGDCGVCDLCLSRKQQSKSTVTNIEEQIIKLLSSNKLTPKEVSSQINAPTTKIAECIDRMLLDEVIELVGNTRLAVRSKR